MATHVRLRGTFYEVGKELGQLQRTNIRAILEHLRQSDFYMKLQQYLQTDEGTSVYDQLRETIAVHCSDYSEELRGVADGAEVNLDDLMLLNLKSDLRAAMGIVPDGSHDVSYAAIFAGCTNILYETEHNQVYLVHTEDIDPFDTDKALVMSVDIIGTDGKTTEKWTEYTVPGELSGSKFGFNSNGVMFGHNNIYQKGFNKMGIPRQFMCRKLMTIRDLDEANSILSTSPGIASAFAFIFVKSYAQDSTHCHVITSVIETVGQEHGLVVREVRPTSFYHHCNILQHLPNECHPEESSVHRAAVISQYINRGDIKTKEDLLKVISDEKDHAFPVYRSGKCPDYLQTGAAGLFDANNGTLEIYLDKPSTSSPQHVMRIHD